jgi:hypothetical protein
MHVEKQVLVPLTVPCMHLHIYLPLGRKSLPVCTDRPVRVPFGQQLSRLMESTQEPLDTEQKRTASTVAQQLDLPPPLLLV